MRNSEVILIAPPSETFRQAEEHLGMGYLSAVLKERGISCEIIDSFLCQINFKKIGTKIKAARPKIIGFSPYQDSLRGFSEIAAFIRKEMPSVHIAAGGFLASFNYDWLFSSFRGLLDSIIIGEGEITFAELAEKIISGKNWRNTKGIVFRKGSKTIKLPAREKIGNLNLLPFPDRPTLQTTILRGNPVHICASRGCYGNCSFCAVNSFSGLNTGDKWRGRSIGNIVDEIERLITTHGITYFKFIDDCFFPSQNKSERAMELCRELDKRALKINFRLSCRVNDVERDTFRLLRDHGLFSVSLGVESTISRQLRQWRKGVTPEQNVSALKICRQLGIVVQMGYIMLDRDSTIEELQAHLAFLKRHNYAITKGIYSSVFAAEGTDLTKEYGKKDVKLKKLGINFDYSFKSKGVSEIAGALGKWNKSYGNIYFWAIDSLSAPKAISVSERKEIHQLIITLKNKELKIFEELLVLAKKGEYSLMRSHLDRKIAESRAFFAITENQLVNFYIKTGLPHKGGRNPYLK